MCTILTVSSDYKSDLLYKRISVDATRNPHGMCLLLADESGVTTHLRTFDVQLVIALVQHTEWTRLWLHSRWATQGSVGVNNIHGWEAAGHIYMHNGCLSDPASAEFDVDSRLIGDWLEYGGVDYAVDCLQNEGFANCLLIHPDDSSYTMSRSKSGSLHTDWRGNYSTSSFPGVDQEVPEYVHMHHDFLESLKRRSV